MNRHGRQYFVSLLTMLVVSMLLLGCRTTAVAPVEVPAVVEEVVLPEPTVPDTLAETPVADTTYSDLATRLSQLLADPILERSQISLKVYDLTSDALVFQHQSAQRTRPASCMKLLTAICALDRLGADHLLTTALMIQPSKTDERACRNVFIRGALDPLFSNADLSVLLDSLSARGIQKIEGNIVLDVSMKDTLRYGKGWCWDDNNPVLYPLLINEKNTFASALRTALQKRGIKIGGKITEGSTDATAVTISTVSHTLRQVLLPTLLNSNNLCAEAILYQIAASQRTLRASAKDAQQVEMQLLSLLGFQKSDYRLADGSGLSLYNYLSADIFIELLRCAYSRDDIRLPLMESLPVAGVSGTISSRMKGTSAQGNIRAKTGTLTGVSSLSGYATSAEGHTLCFSILNTGIDTQAEARGLQDRICVELTR